MQGNIGSRRRKLDFTIIGDCVNCSARLQSFASKTGLPVIFDKKLLDPDQINNPSFSHVQDVELKGKSDIVSSYTISKYSIEFNDSLC